ncbi:MAG TPA: hypothetical protein PLX80_03615 [Ignavibacteria bacterium]|nr:hypothetical protein [Ignavibacteria bacterium]
MENSQLIESLRTLDKNEIKEFGKFIRSPYFNNRSEVIRFFNYIKKFFPEFKSNELKEEIIFKNVYPDKKYSSVMTRKLISLTLNLLLDFLTLEDFKENKNDYNVKMLDMLRKRKLPALFQKRSRITGKNLDISTLDIYYYEQKLKFTSIQNGYFLNSDESSFVDGLQNELNDLIEFFLTGVILQFIRLSEWSRQLNKKFDLKFYDEILKYMSADDEREVTLYSMYFNMLMLLNTEDENYFKKLIISRDTLKAKLGKIDDYNVQIVSMQYCHKKVQKGYPEYRKQMFEITKKLLAADLIPDGFIEPYFFTNIVRNASLLNEFDWLDNFLSEYKHRLNPELSDEITNYSQAMIESAKGNFEKSLMHFSKIKIERSNMKLDMKNLLIIIYYELNFIEELISLIDTNKHFLQRDRSVSDSYRQVSLLLMNFVSELIKIKSSNKKISTHGLRKEIEKSDYFIFKEWLLKKAEELK